MLTVYFDTSFFIDLAKASNVEADAAVDRLNEKRVRAAFSQALAFEMLRNASSPEVDRRLVERLSDLNEPLYLTTPGLSPVVLLASGPAREATATALKDADAAMTLAFSHAILANTDDAHPLRSAATAKAMEAFGLADQSTSEEDRSRAGIEAAMNGLRALGDLAAAYGIPLDDIAVRLADPAIHASLARQSALMASVAGRTEPPYKVALGTISQKSRKKLAHTIRDARHMVEFCEHAYAIDLLQVDGPRYAQMQNDEAHAMRVFGLYDRCFTRPNLQGVVEYVCQAADARE